MTVIVDRRNEPTDDKFGTDKERFRMRYREVIKKAVADQVSGGSIKGFEQGGVNVPIPKETLREPVIHHRHSGKNSRVFPGNLAYDVGDRIPTGGGGGGGGGGSGQEASNDDSSAQDAFIWVSPEEFLDILFEGRKLPDMTKLRSEQVKLMDLEHAGHTNKGPSQKMDMEITNRKRMGDAIPLSKLAEKRVVANLSEQFNILAQYGAGIEKLELDGQNKSDRLQKAEEAIHALKTQFGMESAAAEKRELSTVLAEGVMILNDQLRDKISDEADLHRLEILENRLPEQRKAKGASANFRDQHLTYKYDDDVPIPSAKAVMFCPMDVSASMSQEHKNTAKSFYWLLFNFLKKNYEDVEIVFIAHTTEAKEVDEETFFYGRDTGGTKVSSCLEKMREIIEERYPPAEWNIYGAQASDGDNYDEDNRVVMQLMREMVQDFQAYYYTEIGERSWGPGMLPVYGQLAEEFPNKIFSAQVLNPPHALEVFRSFFPKDRDAHAAPQMTGP